MSVQDRPNYRRLTGIVLHDAIIAIQLSIAGVGIVLYLASFFRYDYQVVAPVFLLSLVICYLASIPGIIRDRRFFKTYWGFGILRLRQKFPFQFFPARSVEWLNPLGYVMMGLSFLHFLNIVISDSMGSKTVSFAGAELRFLSLMLLFGGTFSALSWHYPPTEKPQGEAL